MTSAAGSEQALLGVLGAAAFLLAAAGLAKLTNRTGARSAIRTIRLPLLQRINPSSVAAATGIGELVVAAIALLAGGRIGAGLIGLSYLALAGVSIRLMATDRTADCGCFTRPTVISHWHTAVNLGFGLAGLLAVAWPVRGLAGELAAAPATGVAVSVAAALLAYLCYLAMTALPELLRLTAGTAATPAKASRS